MRGVRPELRELIEPGVKALGFDLVAVELVGGSQHPTLRIYIDSPRGITVDDCARVSRQLSAILEVENPLPGSYVLEVSSPGDDRPLVTPLDFERYIGETIKVRMHQPLAGRKNFTGRLTHAAADRVTVEVDSEQFDLIFDDMDRARLVPKI